MCIYTEQGGVLNSFCSLADYLDIYKCEKVHCMFVHLGKDTIRHELWGNLSNYGI